MIDPAKLLEDLTPPQREAVEHVDGPLLIIAGAGSGKTRVLTRRVAHLISLGIPASSVLAITFTNKAAGEMKQRIEALMGRSIRDFGQLNQPWPMICTFHSLCLRILRHYADVVGLAPNFSIYDSADQTKLIKDAIKALDLSTTNFPASAVHATISNAKNQLLGPKEYAISAGDFYSKAVARIYTKYQALLKANNALDFDDLLMYTAHGFREKPEMLKELQERFSYVLIDEYQDTNHAQYVIAHALALRHKNISVVGDPDQSIYAWRGADIKNILEFETDYPDAKVVKLEQNYRSTKTILSIASSLIAHNRRRKEKGLWTENDQGDKASLFLCQDEHDEAETVADRLLFIKGNSGKQWSDFAIFYRMNSLSRVMEDALRTHKIPYRMARGVEFYNRKEIKDVLAYLRVIANPNDEVSLDRIANTPARGISDSTINQLQTWAIANGTNLWGAMCEAHKITNLTTRAQKACRAFVERVIGWRKLAEAGDRNVNQEIFDETRGDVTRLMEEVVKQSGLEEYYKKAGGEEKEENANINELISSAAEYDQSHPDGSLVDYLAQVSLVSDVDALKDAGGSVTMMTLHAAKGLEFPVVAIIGLEEGCLPHARARGNDKELEEERRLCFVGVTRAEEKLILSKAAYRTIRGLTERTVASQFLNEMSQQDIAVEDHTGIGGAAREEELRERMDEENMRHRSQFRRGQMVRHAKFGIGRVTEITPMGAQTRAVVEFNEAGRKTLILEYAKLEAVA